MQQHSECNPENWLHLKYILNVITKHIWDASGSIFWMESTCSVKSARWSQHWVHSKYNQPVIGLRIVVTLGRSFKMRVICNQQAHFGHSGSKHSECAQFLTITHIVDPLWRTFKMYPIFNCWVHCGQVLSVPTMYSPCAYWVYMGSCPQCDKAGLWLWLERWIHWGRGGLKPVITCWEHWELWLNEPSNFMVITYRTHLKCTHNMYSIWDWWEHFWGIWIVTSTCASYNHP